MQCLVDSSQLSVCQGIGDLCVGVNKGIVPLQVGFIAAIDVSESLCLGNDGFAFRECEIQI